MIDILVIDLSNYGGQQLQITQQQLDAANHELAAWYGGYQQAHHDWRSASREKSLWKRMFSVSTAEERAALARVQGTWQQVNRAEYGRQQIHGRYQQQAAGVEGEDALESGLARLSDEWVMLRGYRNRRGETDHVLVGPLGLWMVEVKRRRVRINAVGDQWWYEKLDRRGNVVETGWAVDGGGRSWARQVNEIARDLAAWLARRGHRVQVRTAVMIMHEYAQLGRCENPTVDLVGFQPQHLLDAIANCASPLSPADCREIVRLTERDHHFHNDR